MTEKRMKKVILGFCLILIFGVAAQGKLYAEAPDEMRLKAIEKKLDQILEGQQQILEQQKKLEEGQKQLRIWINKRR